MVDPNDELLEAVTAAVPPLLQGMEVLGRASRHLHPPHLAQIVEAVAPHRQPIADGLVRFNAAAWPEHLNGFRGAVGDAASNALKAFDGLASAASRSNPVMAAYSALRYSNRATEALYPVSMMLPPVSRFFLLDSVADDEVLAARLAAADASREGVGVLHAANAGNERGGFSLYVPEYHDGTPLPLVVALHGGSGHGRGFLWSWLRAARSFGMLVLSPTSQDSTWSLMGPDVDGPALRQMLAWVSERWPVREDRILLTGMSDGGTFSYVAGLQDDAPYTHLAPIAASFHPMLMEVASPERVAGLPIYLTHGVLDWMFPVDVARTAHEALAGAGAEVVYREIDDLSHTYPTEENEAIARWFLR